MKKWMFGCLGLFIVVAIAGSYGVYRFVYKPAREYLTSFTQLKVVPELNAQVAKKTTFTAPVDGVLSQSAVERFVHVQATIQERLGLRAKELETKYKSLQVPPGTNAKPSFVDAVTALKALSELYIEGKRAQVDALNAQGFSLAEYEWTRGRIYEALGLPIDTTLQQVIRDLSAGKAPDMKAIAEAPPVEVPERNRELVHPFAKELTDRAALVFFAL